MPKTRRLKELLDRVQIRRDRELLASGDDGEGKDVIEETTGALSVNQVFVPGGQPTFTYYPRDNFGLEAKVRDYLDERHKILSVSGPTKSGKTVLLRTVMSRHSPLWLSGGDITSPDVFWQLVADKLGVYTAEDRTDTNQSSSTKTGQAGFSLAPAGVGLKADLTDQNAVTTASSSRVGRTRPISVATKEALRTTKPILVIDDFHYVETDIQQAIVRSLKDLVFDGVGIIFVAVPHRAYDAVRVEREMTGRVDQLTIEFWTEEELLGVAAQGFDALNLIDDSDLGRRLALESFRSPHLMQEFCLALCKENGIRVRAASPSKLAGPNWDSFFTARASQTSKTAFQMLERGPRQRRDRVPRMLKNGQKVDIYGAVLYGIAETGPLTQLTYEELRTSLRQVMSEPPARHEVTRVLEELAKIAKGIPGEPVVDYDAGLATLFISDPFFAYYLRWAVRSKAPG